MDVWEERLKVKGEEGPEPVTATVASLCEATGSWAWRRQSWKKQGCETGLALPKDSSGNKGKGKIQR